VHRARIETHALIETSDLAAIADRTRQITYRVPRFRWLAALPDEGAVLREALWHCDLTTSPAALRVTSATRRLTRWPES
jgi:hypothetical protein